MPISRVCLFLVFSLLSANVSAQEAVPAPAITAEQALAAYDRFRLAPEQSLQEAPTFLRYMQGGAVHTVLNNRVLFWMYRDFPPDVQAVLYAAYMGGNLDSQLRTQKRGDDPAAGIAATLSAYAALKKTHPTLLMTELETLASAQANGRLSEAVTALANAKP
jgi:hypothetical protein